MSSKPKTTKNNPAPVPQGQVVAEFSQYEEASGYVENLVKNNFPPNMILIVGSELKSVERVRGKLSYARVAMSGATTGAWMGLLVGLIFGSGATATDASSAAMGSMTSSLVIGAGIGMLINVIRFSLAKRKRGFISQSSMVAAKYQVQVPVGLTNHPAFNVGDGSGQADA
jgi:hypothetical protein